MQSHDIPNNDQAGRLEVSLPYPQWQVGEIADDDTLLRRGRVFDDGGWRVFTEAMRNEIRADIGDLAQPHVDHQRLPWSRQVVPVDIAASRLEVAGHEHA